MVDLEMKFDITPAAVSYAVQRGEKMAKKTRLPTGSLSYFNI